MRRLLLILLCLLALGGAGWYLHVRLAQNAATTAANGAGGRRGGTPAVPVLVSHAARQDVPVWLDGLGTVQAFNTVTVHSMIDGPLIKVGFQEGQDVKAGDVLALIDPRPTQAALDQATAKKSQDEATLANARLDLVRYTKLVTQNYTSAQTADTQRALVAQDEAQVRQDQAAIDTARTNLSYTTITAPIAGRTGIRQVDAGNIIHASDSNGLVVITQLQPISVVFSLPQQSLPAVAAAMAAGPVTLTASAQGIATQPAPPPASAPGTSPQASATADATDPAPATPGIAVPIDQGTLAVLDNQVDSSTGTIKLKGTFPNPKLTLWPGGFVNVRLLASTLHDAVTVPPVAVQRGPNGTFVYIVGADEKAQRRPITVGHEDEVVSVVTSGLNGGEVVVVDGASRLSDGSTVSISQPASPAGGVAAPAAPAHRRPNGAAPAGKQAAGAPRGAS